MCRLRSFLTLAATAVGGLMPAQVFAQRQAAPVSDSVPRALAEALVAPQFALFAGVGRGGSKPSLIVGILPSTLAQRLWVPPGSTVLGGLESGGYGLAVIRSTLSLDSLKAAYRREQLTRGWTAAPRRTEIPNQGFVPAPNSATDPSDGLLFCANRTPLSINIVPVTGAREIHAQTLPVGLGRELCQQQRPVEGFIFRDHPTLINPPAAGGGRGRNCVNWNSSGGVGSTRLSTSMSLEEVLAHYGRQLADSGWVSTDRQALARSWTRRDTTGALTEVTITARASPTALGCVEMAMDLTRRQP